MSDRRQSNTLGASIDRTRWDYAPPDRTRRALLSPAGSTFSSFPWDQENANDHLGPRVRPAASVVRRHRKPIGHD